MPFLKYECLRHFVSAFSLCGWRNNRRGPAVSFLFVQTFPPADLKAGRREQICMSLRPWNKWKRRCRGNKCVIMVYCKNKKGREMEEKGTTMDKKRVKRWWNKLTTRHNGWTNAWLHVQQTEQALNGESYRNLKLNVVASDGQKSESSLKLTFLVFIF